MEEMAAAPSRKNFPLNLAGKLIVASRFAGREQATREPKGYTPEKTIVQGLVVLMT